MKRTLLASCIEVRPGDRVAHRRDPSVTGTVLSVDLGSIPEEWGVTTCLVRWDDADCNDIQWTNKLEILR